MKLLEVWSSMPYPDRMWVEHCNKEYPYVDLSVDMLHLLPAVYNLASKGGYLQMNRDYERDRGFLICYLGPEGELYPNDRSNNQYDD